MWQTEAGMFYIHDNAETKASDISALCTDLKNNDRASSPGKEN